MTLTEGARTISSLLLAVIFLSGSAGSLLHAQSLSIHEGWTWPELKSPVPPHQDTLEICFFGDMMMHSEQIENARRNGTEYDFTSYFMHLEDKIRKADLAVANMEFTLAGKPYSGYPCFSAPESFADYLAETGFDIFLAANNHILDRGSEGAAATLEKYRKLEKEKGVMFTGLAENEEARNANYPLVVSRKGMGIAFLNITYGTNLGYTEHWPKTNYMGRRAEMKAALSIAENADITIALPHWGPEYTLHHSESQEDTAEWLADNGADIIIGSHPHVVQDISAEGDVPVIYSLGNAVSNMSAENTQLGLMATLRIVRKSDRNILMLPVELTWLWCSRPGGFNDSYTVIPVEEFIGRRAEWKGQWEYDKMIRTYDRLKNKGTYNEQTVNQVRGN